MLGLLVGRQLNLGLFAEDEHRLAHVLVEFLDKLALALPVFERCFALGGQNLHVGATMIRMFKHLNSNLQLFT